jgi:hypothetical protein
MTDDELQAIEARATAANQPRAAFWVVEHDVPALAAEVRRLRAALGEAWMCGWLESGEGHNAEYVRDEEHSRQV